MGVKRGGVWKKKREERFVKRRRGRENGKMRDSISDSAEWRDDFAFSFQIKIILKVFKIRDFFFLFFLIK